MQSIQLIEPVEHAQPVPAPSNIAVLPSATPADLLRIAVQSGADLDRLERLMALQERYEANEARKAFTAAMAAFKAEPLTIFKRKKVGYATREGDFVGYSHAELSDVTDAVGPAMGRHGLSYRWDVKQEGGRINVTCIVTHEHGHSESVTMDAAPDNSGKKNAIQQIASSVTYMQRYTLLSVTGMSTKGMDDDGKGADEPASDADMLQGFKDAAMSGTDELRKHYDKVQPADDWWAKHSKELKAAAKVADAAGAQR